MLRFAFAVALTVSIPQLASGQSAGEPPQSTGRFNMAQTQPWKGTQAEYSQRCRDTNLPGKHFYMDRNNAGQRGYCCTTADKTQGWCCWDRGGGNFSCAAR